MLIPKHHRQHLKSLGYPHWFWYEIHDWAFGKRYKFRDGLVVYLFDDEIISLRRGAEIIWRKEVSNG